MKQATPSYLVITDLDGTLLDHDNYSFDAATPSLAQLEQHQVPVVINSSKTQAEISELRKALNNTHPFICENGSAILTPTDYDFTGDDSSTHSTFNDIVLGKTRDEILNTLTPITNRYSNQLRQYSQCSIEDIVEMTGLSYTEAEQSGTRFYTEPIQWQGSNENRQHFIKELEDQGLKVLQGGRFLHAMGETDKGKATRHLQAIYHQKRQATMKIIALGDSHNDIAMLQAADIAVLVRSPHYPPPEFDHPHKIVTQHYGPKGWHEAIQQLIFSNEYYDLTKRQYHE